MKLKKTTTLSNSAALLVAITSGSAFANSNDINDIADKAQAADYVLSQGLDSLNYEMSQIANDVLTLDSIVEEHENELSRKIDSEEVTTAFNVIEEEIANKVDIEDLASLADKAQAADYVLAQGLDSLNYEVGQVAKKAEKADLLIAAEVEKKANKTEVQNLVNSSNQRITAEVEKKANKTEVQNLVNSSNQLIAQNTARLQNLDHKVNKLDKKVNRGLATQAALSGLFQPYSVGKANITAAVGGYKSNSAIAIGTGYRFNENFAAKAGVAVSTGGGNAVSYNVGVNYEW